MKIRTTIWIDEELIKQTKHYAVDQGKSVSEIIEAALRELVSQ